jgi:hypothetical protein
LEGLEDHRQAQLWQLCRFTRPGLTDDDDDLMRTEGLPNLLQCVSHRQVWKMNSKSFIGTTRVIYRQGDFRQNGLTAQTSRTLVASEKKSSRSFPLIAKCVNLEPS